MTELQQITPMRHAELVTQQPYGIVHKALGVTPSPQNTWPVQSASTIHLLINNDITKRHELSSDLVYFTQKQTSWNERRGVKQRRRYNSIICLNKSKLRYAARTSNVFDTIHNAHQRRICSVKLIDHIIHYENTSYSSSY